MTNGPSAAESAGRVDKDVDDVLVVFSMFRYIGSGVRCWR